MNKKKSISTDSNVEPGPSPDLMMEFLHAAHSLQNRMEEAFEEVDLSSARYGLLAKLAEAGKPLSLGELAAQLSCVRSNMTQLVDRMEADGLVRRQADPMDRRSVLAELTQRGKKLEAAGAVVMKKVRAEFAASLTPDQRMALESMLLAPA